MTGYRRHQSCTWLWIITKTWASDNPEHGLRSEIHQRNGNMSYDAWPYISKTYNKDIQQRHATKTNNKDIRQRHTAKAYNKDKQQRYTTKTNNKEIQRRHTTKTYNENIHQRHTTKTYNMLSLCVWHFTLSVKWCNKYHDSIYHYSWYITKKVQVIWYCPRSIEIKADFTEYQVLAVPEVEWPNYIYTCILIQGEGSFEIYNHLIEGK